MFSMLYIDDIRMPKEFGYDIVRTSRAAVTYMKREGCPRYISFDHDLGGEDNSMIIVRWMVETDMEKDGKFIPENFEWFVHSANPVGVENINGLLKGYLTFRNESENE